MITRSALINVMIKAATKAGKALVRDFGEVEQLQVSRKGPGDFVSAADIKAERLVRAELSKARPDFGFLMEESGETAGRDKDHLWVVDPLDGTTNFLHGIPHWAVSIGLVRNGEPVAGVIYDPIHDLTYWAEKGQGAFLNSRRLRVSARRRLDEALFATGIPFKGRPGHEEFLRQVEVVMRESAGVRRFGAASLDLAAVAAGQYEGFWESGLKPWDVAAGIILVSEAGGFVTEIDGGRDPLYRGNLLAANSHLHLYLGKLLREAGKPVPSEALSSPSSSFSPLSPS